MHLTPTAALSILLLGTAPLTQSATDGVSAHAASNDQSRAEHELSRIATVIAELEREMRRGEADRTKASRDLEKHERAIDQIAREQRSLTATADTLKKHLNRLQSTHEALHQELRRERTELAGELRVAYAMGRGDRAKLLLQHRDPGSIGRLLRYHSYFTRAQRERIVILEQTLLQLSDTEREIADETRRLSVVHQRHREQRQALEHERDLRAGAMATLNAELADSRSAVERLKKDQKRLAKLVLRLRNAINDVPAESEPPRSFKALRGKLPWPVRGSLKRRFGARRDDSGLAMQGVLVKAPMGDECGRSHTDVSSSRTGCVVSV